MVRSELLRYALSNNRSFWLFGLMLLWLTMLIYPVAGAKRLLNPSAMNSNLQDRVAEVSLASNDLISKATRVAWGRQDYRLDDIAQSMKRLVDRHAFYDRIYITMSEEFKSILEDGMKRKLFHRSTTLRAPRY